MLWIKAFHIITMVAWFSGIFYLPRLFVYHTDAKDEISIARFKIMERRLYYGITTPSAVLTVILGTGLISLNFKMYMSMGWIHAKLALVVLLIIYHIYCGVLVNSFKHDNNKRGAAYYRWLNELPLLFLIPIILLAVVRPF